MTIRILIADDHQIMREGLRVLLEKETDMQVVAEASDGRKAVELAHKLSPAVVILDVSMPELNGIEAARQILRDRPNTHIVALSMHSDRRFVLEMLEAGASGYLLKDSAFEELSRAIRTVIAGQTYLSPGVTSVVVKARLSPDTGTPSLMEGLTPREREVLQLIAEGKTTKQVAMQLHLSVKTIETHRRQIMNKLGIYSIAELTKFAVREGLTSLED